MVARIDGLARSDVGKTRKYNSIEERDAARKEQKKRAKKKWFDNNKDKVDKQRKEYRSANSAICIERTKKWQRENPDKPRDYVYKKKYGISLEEYNSMCEKRKGCCDICGQEKKLVVDHCHTNNEVRGFLCDRCNVALGSFGDSPERLRSAAKYIESYVIGYTKLVENTLND